MGGPGSIIHYGSGSVQAPPACLACHHPSWCMHAAPACPSHIAPVAQPSANTPPRSSDPDSGEHAVNTANPRLPPGTTLAAGSAYGTALAPTGYQASMVMQRLG